MTRKQFIAETARAVGASFASQYAHTGDDQAESAWAVKAKRFGVALANVLESDGSAPWLTPPAPALTDAARRGGEAAVEWIEADPTRYVCLDAFNKLIAAVSAYKESAK